MALLVFTDTTALINLFLVHRLDLLPQIAPGRCRWTQTLYQECRHREKREREDPGSRLQLDGLAAAAEMVLGEPLIPEGDEHRAVRDLRQALASPGDAADQHLGEAEVITIVRRRNLRALFVTDDTGATQHAQGTPYCVDTWQILRLAKRKGLLTYGDMMQIRSDLRHYQRVRPNSFIHDPDAFRRWVNE